MHRILLLLGAAAGLAACGDDKGTSQTSTDATTPPGDVTTSAATTAITTGEPEPTGPGSAGTTGTTVGEDGSSTGLPATTSEGPKCTGALQTLPLARAKAMLVLEKSVQMDDEWDHDADPRTPTVTRWSSLHAAVDQGLAEFEDQLDVGANLFPSEAATNEYSTDACPVSAMVEAPTAPANRDEILAAIPAKGSVVLGGGWPVAAALTAAVAHLDTYASTDPRFIVLVLSGLPSCNADAPDDTSRFEVYDEDAPAVAGAAFTDGRIKTHVIAFEALDKVTSDAKDGRADGVNPVEKYSELATLGGSGDFTNVVTEAAVTAALKATLAKLLADEAGCVLALKDPLEFPDLAVVRVDGVDLARVDSCAGGDGWRFLEDAPPFTAIQLCGAACEQLRQHGEAEVQDCSDAPG